MSHWDYYDYYQPSRPIKAKGGIKAQSKRGGFGQSWWAKRWIALLESFNIGARLGRGKSYARKGQVLSIDIGQGTVTAEVQGSRPKPYDINIQVKTLTAADWKKLAETLGKQAIFAAKLMAGEMPEDIESAFKDAGLSLFPQKLDDLKTKCSCPDWANPCKHIAAVYYLLGEEFDRNPFLIFKLRGMEREELAGLIGKAVGVVMKPKASRAKPELAPPPPPEPLSPEPEAFWGKDTVPDNLLGEAFIPPVTAALVKRLGNFAFWRSEENFLETMQQIYRKASSKGLEAFLGERDHIKRNA